MKNGPCENEEMPDGMIERNFFTYVERNSQCIHQPAQNQKDQTPRRDLRYQFLHRNEMDMDRRRQKKGGDVHIAQMIADENARLVPLWPSQT